MAAPAVAGGAVAAAGGFSLLAVIDHASDDQANDHQQNSQNQYSSHNSFLSRDRAAGGGEPSPAFCI